MRWLVGMALVSLAAACGGPTEPVPGPRLVELKIKTLNPGSVYLDGTDNVTIKTENGCGREFMTLTVDGVPVTPIQQVSLDEYTFTAPPKQIDVSSACALGEYRAVVVLRCSQHPDPNTRYSQNEASTQLVYNADIEPGPRIQTFFPSGDDFSRDSKMTVVFTRPMDPTTVTNDTFSIEGVPGVITASADGRTFVFTPAARLESSHTYTCVVKAGTSGVRTSTTHRPLCATVAPDGSTTIDPDADRWTFTTVAQ